ncbi:acid-sensing ion channel 5-like [Mya arenaria]|uniref:acid-sensing ion channel 5-like n=1 Tax=Mya arenaria TaxID=6604 RepID=UPI0022E5ADB3|nr:acid-sensing ion channel 5-like [Mya arenaria]
MGKTAVSEYMDYSTVHGMGRLKNTPFKVLKLIWILALAGSFGMIIWQVIELYIKFRAHPVSTSIEIKTPKRTKFPFITICNTNSLQYSRFPSSSPLESVITEASEKYKIDTAIFNETQNLYDYNYTEFDKTDISSSFDNDILFDSAEMFKTRMALLDYETLFNYSQPMKEFMLICNFAGSKCTEYSFLHAIRSYDYGICYVFDPSYQLCQDPDSESGCGYVASAGQQYGLELLLNVDQAETVPFVTSSSGVLIIPSDRFNDYIDVNKGVFVPTGFEASVALRKKSTLRVPGMDVDRKRCDDTATISYEECIRDSQEQHILETCGCVQHFYKSGYLNASLSPENTVDPDTGNIPCYTEEHQKCVRHTLSQFILKKPDVFDDCLPSCEEHSIDKKLALLKWPNEHFTPILRRIMKSKLPKYDLNSLNRNKIRDNLLLVRVFLESLSYENVKEEYSYGIVNFVSDIGGQLGLWAGFSVLSVLEVIELILLLFAMRKREAQTAARDATSMTQVQPVKDTDISLRDKV